ncbi:hypothetical protein E0L93_14465 [Rubrobacter taiwanensis]|jgi:uncharacterized protein YqgC (DUF456 family)|uniref:CbtB-domain containing protein n=1 Tax=Rubrobacter taiwanensis TaxID=185139 RepID=A0A4R1B9M5_9ACTN|nr:CbtB-domain containing protein [Rubrobacter taiwanensis]TCJ13621.1 hypothetical protein E0L93_14465 [Rubrobacter taiwanensis]
MQRTLGDAPAAIWPALAGLLLLAFAVLYDNGLLLVPLLGEAAHAQNYLHALFHDGRHMLGVPCH